MRDRIHDEVTGDARCEDQNRISRKQRSYCRTDKGMGTQDHIVLVEDVSGRTSLPRPSDHVAPELVRCLRVAYRTAGRNLPPSDALARALKPRPSPWRGPPQQFSPLDLGQRPIPYRVGLSATLVVTG